jgi:two-component system, sensor histidine kinase and response regulator
MADEPKAGGAASLPSAAFLPIDLSVLVDLADGDPVVEAELVAIFVRHTSEGISKTRAALSADQAPEAARIVHTCIGFTATLGIVALVPLLRELQGMVQDDRRDEAERLIAEWERGFEQVQCAMRSRISVVRESLRR